MMSRKAKLPRRNQPHAQQCSQETSSSLQIYMIHSSNCRSTIRKPKIKPFLKVNIGDKEAWSSRAHYNHHYPCSKKGAFCDEAQSTPPCTECEFTCKNKSLL